MIKVRRDTRVLRQCVRPLEFCLAGNVIPRRERPARARQHDGAHLRIGLRLIKRLMQLPLKVRADGIQPLGPIQRDKRALALLLIQDVLVVGHSTALPRLSPGLCVPAACHDAPRELTHTSRENSTR